MSPPPGKDSYVVTSNGTFSAAEEFAYNLENLKRANIIGEVTGGGAHSVGPTASTTISAPAFPSLAHQPDHQDELGGRRR